MTHPDEFCKKFDILLMPTRYSCSIETKLFLKYDIQRAFDALSY